MCLNYVQGGKCYATGQECLLGVKGASVRNDTLECRLHGKFDVWVMQDGKILVSDLGIPSDEPKECVALGINPTLAVEIGRRRAKHLGTLVQTTERKCHRCGSLFWMSEHDSSSGAAKTGRGYFCPKCIPQETEATMARELGILGHWCG
jgi:hypothetical protein